MPRKSRNRAKSPAAAAVRERSRSPKPPAAEWEEKYLAIDDEWKTMEVRHAAQTAALKANQSVELNDLKQRRIELGQSRLAALRAEAGFNGTDAKTLEQLDVGTKVEVFTPYDGIMTGVTRGRDPFDAQYFHVCVGTRGIGIGSYSPANIRFVV